MCSEFFLFVFGKLFISSVLYFFGRKVVKNVVLYVGLLMLNLLMILRIFIIVYDGVGIIFGNKGKFIVIVCVIYFCD